MAARALFDYSDSEEEYVDEQHYLRNYGIDRRHYEMEQMLHAEQHGGALFGDHKYEELPRQAAEHPELVRRVIYDEQFGGDENSILYQKDILPAAERAQITKTRDLRNERQQGILPRRNIIEAIDELQAGEIMSFEFDYDDIKGDVFSLIELLPLRNEVETDKYLLHVMDEVIAITPSARVNIFNALRTVNRSSVDRLFQLYGVENEVGSAKKVYANLQALSRRGGSAFQSQKAQIKISRIRTVDEASIRSGRERRNRLAGSAFKYHHKIDGLDLTRYQIFHVEDDFLHDEKLLDAANTPCMLYALQRAGLPKEKCAHLSQIMARKCRTISKLDIKRICKLLRIRIDLRLEQASRNSRKKTLGKMFLRSYPNGKAAKGLEDLERWPKYALCLVRDHYMAYDEDTKVYIRGTHCGSTTNLIRFLLKNRQHCLTPVTKREKYIKTWHYEKLRNDFSCLDYNEKIHSLPYGARVKLEEIYEDKEVQKQAILKKEMRAKKQKQIESLSAERKRDIEDAKRRLCFAFDFETTTHGDKHIPYMVACQRVPEPRFEFDDVKNLPITVNQMKDLYSEEERKEFQPRVFHGKDCAIQMQTYIIEVWKRHQKNGRRVMNAKGNMQAMFKPGILLIAHNAGYDLRFLMSSFVAWGGDPLFTAQGSNLKSFQGYWPEDRFCVKRREDNAARASKGEKPRKRTREERKLVSVQVHDSLNFTMCALKKFPKMFNLEKMVKEIMPYELYTQDLVSQAHHSNNFEVLYPMKKAIQFLEKSAANNPKANYAALHKYQNCSKEDVKRVIENDIEQFKANVKRWDCLKTSDEDGEDYFDMIKYSSEYCKLDVKILAQGYAVLRHMFYVVTDGLNIDHHVSVNHLTNSYLQNYGCTEGVYELSGIPREFIQKCVTGGKCMLRNNQVQHYEGQVADFDAVSLYPSAMAEMPGLLRGKPKVIPEHGLTYEWLDKAIEGGKCGAWFAEVEILKVGKKWQMPICNEKTDSGRNFTNDMVGKTMHCSHVVAQDMKKFQDIEMKIVKGYYFNEGYNDLLRTFITGIFNERLKMKKVKNPMQLVYKLMMNGCYGRLILKPIDEEIKFVRRDYTATNEENEQTALLHVLRSWNSVKSLHKLDESCPWGHMIKQHKPMYSHWAAPHLGVMILDFSKRIMNRLHDLAHKHDWPIFYMDTDSMHLRDEDVKEMAKEFKKKYPHINDGELIGKKLGQFHNDFDLSAIGPTKLPTFDDHEVRSKKFVAFGKKCYMHELYVPSQPDIQGVSIAMKGFTENAIYDCCLSNNMTLSTLYKKVYDGEQFKANLLAGNRVSFRYNPDFTVCSVQEMHRTISRTGLVR